jgi:hypothetical protein
MALSSESLTLISSVKVVTEWRDLFSYSLIFDFPKALLFRPGDLRSLFLLEIEWVF